ncbi:MAG: hypothetical protein LBG88_00690 [Christensenellaceae bacterium]|jgi:UDP-N-acetylmuramoyl-tripeptide--D-alanyl-D-alanine ligase|nr:hypothetical protein [Christensenellaceae bacterium]
MLTLQITVSILSAALLCGLGIKLVHIFQLEGYKPRNLLRWLLKRNPYFITLVVVALLGAGSGFIIGFFAPGLFSFLGLLPYFAFGIFAIVLNLKKPAKIPLKYTARVKRLLGTIAIVADVVSFILLYFAPPKYLPITAAALPVMMLVAIYIILPTEKLIGQIYLRRARKKLFSPEYKDLIRIGITGSYGKTTCKNILAEMLSKKYAVVASPASFNTPMGFCRTVLGELKPDTQVLIMEMGARKRGDIKQMCKLFKPQHGLLTSIGKCHLETFKTEENIRAEKMELLNAVPNGGIKINGDIVPFMEFPRDFKTRLVGAHNRRNIMVCSEMALELGVSQDQIRVAVAELKPTPHRLELIESPNGVRILDDSFNSSPHGAFAALTVLADLKKSSPGASAIVITPGMIELGASQYDDNRRFGAQMVGIADHVIIVGETNKRAIYDGLHESPPETQFPESKIHFAKNLDEGKTIFGTLLKPGDILLIENDLPDNF